MLHFKHQCRISSKYGFSGTSQEHAALGRPATDDTTAQRLSHARGGVKVGKTLFLLPTPFQKPTANAAHLLCRMLQLYLGHFLSSHCSVLKSASSTPYNLNSPTADMPKLPIFKIVIFCLISTVITAPDPTFTPPTIIV